jgi:photosystem II stability/assembly factor-like uncharacterized protein
MYVGLTSDEGSSTIFASDDAGVTWGQAGAFDPGRDGSTIRGLTYDPNTPDQVWVAVNPGGIEASRDGGQTWSSISPDDWTVSDIALGIDGANLYAATSNGVFRLPLT